jgi:hypothetical protein
MLKETEMLITSIWPLHMVHTYETITLHPINMYSYLPIQKKKKKLGWV